MDYSRDRARVALAARNAIAIAIDERVAGAWLRILKFGDERLPKRFWDKGVVVRTTDTFGIEHTCWIWTGSTTSKGYGSFYLGKRRDGRQRTGVVHKMTYELANGRIKQTRAKGKRLVLDHKCRNRACFNPECLELVLEPINVRRGESPSARHARKTHCPKGHAYSKANTYVLRIKRGGHDTTKRYCRTCRRSR